MVDPLNRPSGSAGMSPAGTAGIVALAARLENDAGRRAAGAERPPRRRAAGDDAVGEPLPATFPLVGGLPSVPAPVTGTVASGAVARFAGPGGVVAPVTPTERDPSGAGGPDAPDRGTVPPQPALPEAPRGSEREDDRPQRRAGGAVADQPAWGPLPSAERREGGWPPQSLPGDRPVASADRPAPSPPALVYRFASWGAAHAVRIERHTGSDGRVALRLAPSDAAVRRVLGRHLAWAPPGTVLGGGEDGQDAGHEEETR